MTCDDIEFAAGHPFAMQAYIDWELQLVAQIANDESAIFAPSARTDDATVAAPPGG